jgi:hypothetical protein
MDIMVTTPKSEMANAAREAAECLAAGGGEYFRRFPAEHHPDVQTLDRVYYVEDGYLRGYAVVSETQGLLDGGRQCDTTGRRWGPGFYAFMDARSWHWIEPAAVRGFQGFRYVRYDANRMVLPDGRLHRIVKVGGWRDPKPEIGEAVKP